MAKTTVSAAARWDGDGFVVEDIPDWLAQAVAASKLSFDPPNLGVTTAGGPVSAVAGDWLMVLEDGSLATAADADFNANYEIT